MTDMTDQAPDDQSAAAQSPEAQIRQIMADLFDMDVKSISPMSGPDSIDHWDSLRHMQLVLCLEEEFTIELSDEEVMQIVDFQSILEHVQAHQARR